MATSDAGAAMIPFGFTGLESQVYAYLVGQPAATGYRISQAIGKPVANTYKAIQTLHAKGAIVIEDGEARVCRAVPADELLGRLTREFEKHREDAKDSLAKLCHEAEDDRVYSIRSKSQALAKARQMLADAKQTVLLAARSDALSELQAELGDAAARGAEIAAKCDSEVDVPRVETYLATRQEDLLRHGPYFRLVVDARQCLAGRFGPQEDEGELLWSRSRVLSLLMHEGLAAEITLLAVTERIEDGAGPKRLARALTQVRAASAIATS